MDGARVLCVSVCSNTDLKIFTGLFLGGPVYTSKAS